MNISQTGVSATSTQNTFAGSLLAARPAWSRPLDLVQFGESLKAKLARYEAEQGDRLERLDPEHRSEPVENLRKVRAEAENPSSEMVTKQPGQNVWFSTRSPLALIDRNDPTGGKEKPQGLFNNDMQHLDHFMIRVPGARNPRSLMLEGSRDITDVAAGITGFELEYGVEGSPAIKIKRRQSIDAQGILHEEFTFRNTGNSNRLVSIELGSKFRDIFQARSPNAEKLSTEIIASSRTIPGTKDIELEAEHRLASGQPVDLERPNILRTRISPHGEGYHLERKDDSTVVMQVAVPRHGEVSNGLSIATSSDRFGFAQYMPETYKQTWDSFATSLDIKTSDRSMKHLPQMWQTSFKDLRALTIPVQCGKGLFFPAAAGIPNFLALFGRDSIITAMQTLQMNGMLARDTLASLAYYQGKKSDPFTEEEPGKILHELRLGETTRLGISPHKPYYGTIDATPLWIILFDDYLKRSPDPTLQRVLWPNFEAALQWVDDHVIDNPGSPLDGFLTQRDLERTDESTVRGAQGLKNIGWKDSDGATRHLVEDRHGNILDKGADGTIRSKSDRILVNPKGELTAAGRRAGLKLTYAKYPLALAEVQAYVYGAWQAAENLYAKRAAASTNMRERESNIQKSRTYGEKAARLRKNFNEKFWMPNENFIAMALQADGRALTSVTSNGAQALMTGIVDYDKAEKMSKRLMQPDMVSGWGARTLSAYSFAYDPFAYHNGTIWPHDNSLIVKGLSYYGFKSPETGVSLGSQVLRAGGKFPKGRLPELYTGMPRAKGDREVPVYPNTCIPQAWAAGTPPLIVSSLLGLRVDEAGRAVYFDHPVFPEGISAMRLTLGVRPKTIPVEADLAQPGDIQNIEDLNRELPDVSRMVPGENVTLELTRQPDGTVKVAKLAGSPSIGVYVTNRQDEDWRSVESASSVA